MLKHFYFYSSNLDYIKLIDEDFRLERVPEYDPFEMKDVVPNEWGRIKTENSYFHLILGRIPQKGCPWCASEMVLKKIENGINFGHYSYCMGCPNCGARGPVVKVNDQVESVKSDFERIK